MTDSSDTSGTGWRPAPARAAGLFLVWIVLAGVKPAELAVGGLAAGAATVILQRMAQRLPQIPEGDIVAAAAGIARKAGVMAERMDAQARRWPIAGLLFLATTVILAATLMGAR